MKSNIKLVLFILFTGIFAQNITSNETDQKNELKTFIVRTKLTKEELEELLSQSEVSKVKNDKSPKVESENNVKEINATLQKQIEEEEKKEDLIPAEEFKVKEMKDSNNTKAFISKTETKKINSFYEKKYGRTYAYLILFLELFLIYYFRGFLFKGKENVKKNGYINIFENSQNEYMLVKSE